MSWDSVIVTAPSSIAWLDWVHFKHPRWLQPTEKGAGPFRYYALDYFVQLSPAAPNWGPTIVIAIDLFTKWLEYVTLAHLDLYHIMHKQLACKYGVPMCLRSKEQVPWEIA